MKLRIGVQAIVIGVALSSTIASSDDFFEHGGDVYRGAADINMSNDAGRDAFVAGYSVELTGDVAEDAHAAGFNVNIDGDVNGNLYAVGSNVSIDGRVGKDLTASGFTVHIESDAMVAGNARLAGGSIIVDAPVSGALLASGGTIKLNDSVTGDVSLIASDIKFGNDAVIGGFLNYSSVDEIAIPSSVISSDRVNFTRIKHGNTFRHIRDTVDDSVPDFWPRTLVSRVMGILVILAFLLIVASVFLAFTPEMVERLRHRATEHAWRSIFYGFLGLSTLFGAIPVSAMTIIGIPLIPIVILMLIAVWALGYLLGVYVIASRIWRTLEIPPHSVFGNLLVFASGLIAMVVVNFIPFIGWLLNIGVVFFGVGAITYAMMERLVRRHEATRPKALTKPQAQGANK